MPRATCPGQQDTGARTLWAQGSRSSRPPAGYASTPHALVSFCEPANCADGAQPNGGLIADANGNLFGTTFGTPKATRGGCADSGGGTVFEITDSGFVPYKFDGTPESPSCFEQSVSALAQQVRWFHQAAARSEAVGAIGHAKADQRGGGAGVAAGRLEDLENRARTCDRGFGLLHL